MLWRVAAVPGIGEAKLQAHTVEHPTTTHHYFCSHCPGLPWYRATAQTIVFWTLGAAETPACQDTKLPPVLFS